MNKFRCIEIEITLAPFFTLRNCIFDGCLWSEVEVWLTPYEEDSAMVYARLDPNEPHSVPCTMEMFRS